MKKIRNILLIFCFVLSLGLMVACDDSTRNPTPTPTPTPTPDELKDYVAQTKLNINVTASHNFFGDDGVGFATLVRCVDGDTAIFIANKKEFTARFLGVDTPESTGQVEEWGKTASKFTADKLENAVSIVVQTNGGAAQLDTTGNRYLTYVWYQPSKDAEYRLLNLELVQEGLSYGKSGTASLYADVLVKAQDQAMQQKLKIFGPKGKDPNFYYGDAIEVTIKYVLEHQKDLSNANAKVKFDCTVVKEDGLYVYVQDYDAETDKVFSILLYKGYNLKTKKLSIGNRVSIHGTVQEYEGKVQISGMQDLAVDSLENITLLGTNQKIYTTTLTVNEINSATSDMERMLVKLENVKVTKLYTTTEGSSAGAITITGEVDSKEVTIRTSVLLDDSYNKITEDYFRNKTITVIGILETYNNSMQVRVVSIKDVTIIE